MVSLEKVFWKEIYKFYMHKNKTLLRRFHNFDKPSRKWIHCNRSKAIRQHVHWFMKLHSQKSVQWQKEFKQKKKTSKVSPWSKSSLVLLKDLLRKWKETEFSAKLFSDRTFLFSLPPSISSADFPFRATFLPVHSWFPEWVLHTSC